MCICLLCLTCLVHGQWVWESSADSTFSVYEDPGEDLGRGTKIVLSLKVSNSCSAARSNIQEDCLEFLEEERLKGLIKRYSEFINFPIYLFTSKEEVHLFPANVLPLGIGRSSHAIVDHV